MTSLLAGMRARLGLRPLPDDEVPRHQNPYLLVLLPLAVSAVLGAYRLGAKSLWLDETSSLYIARLDWPAAWHVMVTQQANMMLYYVLLHYWLGLGLGEATIRSLSTIAAVASIVPFFLLGVHLFGARHALLASLLLATNAFFIEYAQEARAYGLLLLLTATFSLLFVRAIDRPTVGRCVAYAAVSALAVYTHFFAGWVVAVQILATLLPFDSLMRRLRLLAAQGVVAALVMPLAVFASHRHGALSWLPRPTRKSLIEFGDALTGHGGPALASLYLVLCALFLLASWLPNAPAETRRRLRWSQAFLLAWLGLPVLGTFLFSRLVTPAFSPRFLIVSLLPLPLLVAGGLQMLRPAWLKLATLAVLFLLTGRGLRTWYVGPPKEDWRAAAEYVLAHGRPGDGVVLHPPFYRRPFEYYLLRSDSVRVEPVLPSSPWGQSLKEQELATTLFSWWRDHPVARSRIWLVERTPAEVRLSLPSAFVTRYCLDGITSFDRVRVHLFRACAPSD